VQLVVDEVTVKLVGHVQVDVKVELALTLVNEYTIEVLFVIVLLELLTFTLVIVQPALAVMEKF